MVHRSGEGWTDKKGNLSAPKGHEKVLSKLVSSCQNQNHSAAARRIWKLVSSSMSQQATLDKLPGYRCLGTELLARLRGHRPWYLPVVMRVREGFNVKQEALQ